MDASNILKPALARGDFQLIDALMVGIARRGGLAGIRRVVRGRRGAVLPNAGSAQKPGERRALFHGSVSGAFICTDRIRGPDPVSGPRRLSTKIPLRFESSPFRGKRAADTTAKPTKTFSAIPPFREGQSARPLSVGRFSQSADGATVD